LKTTSNIQTLIRDLYHPSYKSVINLSWINEKAKTSTNSITAPEVKKITEQSNNNTNNRKRPIPFSNKDGPSNHKQSKQMYSPPYSKYSSRFATQSSSQNNNKFNNFRGKFKGRRNDKPYNNNKNRQY